MHFLYFKKDFTLTNKELLFFTLNNFHKRPALKFLTYVIKAEGNSWTEMVYSTFIVEMSKSRFFQTPSVLETNFYIHVD